MNYTKEQLHNLFIQLYEEKGAPINQKEIGQKLGVSGETVRRYINECNAYEDCPDVFRNVQKPLHCFDEINNESAYWLGYLMADGCYTTDSKGKNYRLMLECKIEDKQILEHFCDFVGIRKERITIGHKGRSAALSMADSNFTTSVTKYGICENKSHTENHLPQIFINNEILFFQYFRGLIDGDGTIHTSANSKGISLVGNSLSLLEEIKKELEKYIPEPTSIWIMEKTIEQQKGKKASQSLYTLKIGTGMRNHSNMKYIYDKFYSNQKIILDRKEVSFKSIL